MTIHKRTTWITRTGILLALVILSQLLGKMIPAGMVIAGPFNTTQLLTGSLVNLMLLLAVETAGISSGAAVGVLSALLATLLGIGPIFPQITPLIALGNVILVVTAGGFFRAAGRRGGPALRVAGITAGAVLKCGFLWVTVPLVLGLLPEVKPPQAAMLTLMFSWPQLVTALVGGTLFLAVSRRLPRDKAE